MYLPVVANKIAVVLAYLMLPPFSLPAQKFNDLVYRGCKIVGVSR